jgi:hypothetical protein
VPGLLRDVDVNVRCRQAGTLARARRKRLAEPLEIVGGQRHPERGDDARSLAQRLKRGNLLPKAALDPANLVVQGLVPIKADGDDDSRPRPAAGDALDASDNAIGLEPVGGKVKQREARPAGQDRVEDLVDVGPQEDLAAGEVESSSVGFRRQMLHVLHLY